MKSKIEYQTDALVISLPCSDPAAMHSQLMQSIAQNLHCIFACNQQHSSPVDMAPIISILQSILPGERELNKLYQ